jgi:hypothetical protein
VFTIDLLKGQGIPIKTMPGGMILVAMAFFVPALFTVVLAGNYIHGSIVISTQKNLLNDCESKIEQLSAGLEVKQTLDQEAGNIILFLQETADYLDYQIQWSPILKFLAANIPESLTMEQLKVSTVSVTKTVPKRNEPEKKTSVSIPKRTLSIILYGNEKAGSNEAALELQRVLQESEILASKIEDARIVSQKADKTKGVIYYGLHCIFKFE